MLNDPTDGLMQRMGEEWYGYGRWQAPYWFVGPEPGMAKDEGDNSIPRCEAWNRLGGAQLLDCLDHHREFKHMKFHRIGNPAIQSTWGPLIKLLMSYEGKPTDKEMIRSYQARKWGRADGETCVVELSPFAANNKKVPTNRSRSKDQRIAKLQYLIDENCPRFVLCYGQGNLKDFETLAGGSFDEDGFRERGKTLFMFRFAPTWPSERNTQSYWIESGLLLKSRLA